MSARQISDYRSGSYRSSIARSRRILGIYEKLIAATRKRGQFAGLHNGSAAYAARMIGMGFRFVTIANDSGLMAKAAKEAVQATRKAAGDVAGEGPHEPGRTAGNVAG